MCLGFRNRVPAGSQDVRFKPEPSHELRLRKLEFPGWDLMMSAAIAKIFVGVDVSKASKVRS